MNYKIIFITILFIFIFLAIPATSDGDGDEIHEQDEQEGPENNGSFNSGDIGMPTIEPLENVIGLERQNRNLIADTPVIYSLVSSEPSIYQIIVTNTRNESNVSVITEYLKDTSKHVKEPAPGVIYTNENVWAESENINKITIKFRIENDWIDNNNLTRDNINLLKWNENKWVFLEVNPIGKDDRYTYLKSDNILLSKFINSSEGQFVITGIKSEEIKSEKNTIPTIIEKLKTLAKGLIKKIMAN